MTRDDYVCDNGGGRGTPQASPSRRRLWFEALFVDLVPEKRQHDRGNSEHLGARHSSSNNDCGSRTLRLDGSRDDEAAKYEDIAARLARLELYASTGQHGPPQASASHGRPRDDNVTARLPWSAPGPSSRTYTHIDHSAERRRFQGQQDFESPTRHPRQHQQTDVHGSGGPVKHVNDVPPIHDLTRNRTFSVDGSVAYRGTGGFINPQTETRRPMDHSFPGPHRSLARSSLGGTGLHGQSSVRPREYENSGHMPPLRYSAPLVPPDSTRPAWPTTPERASVNTVNQPSPLRYRTPPSNGTSPAYHTAFSPHRVQAGSSRTPLTASRGGSSQTRQSPFTGNGHSAESPSSENAKPNQCHGTTGSGKRCTRTVGVSRRTSSPAKANAADENSSGPSSNSGGRHTAALLQQLDRRLSIKQRSRRSAAGRNNGQRGDIIDLSLTDSDEDAYFDESYWQFGRLAHSPAPTKWNSAEVLFKELPVYCFQHAKQALEQPGTYVGPHFVNFSEWISQTLPKETQIQLRVEMSKPVSSEDCPGYIYVHEVPDKALHQSSTTLIKLGRSTKPIARLSQWRSQCKSRQPIVRDIFPLATSRGIPHNKRMFHPHLEHDGMTNTSPSRVQGTLSIAEAGAPYHHRWERLCLIELAGVAALQAERRSDAEQVKQRCPDCKRIHAELFLVDKGTYEREVLDIVTRWQRFVESVL